MSAPRTSNVLGAIGAMQTLLDNFPMNILDMLREKEYASVFDFLLDVLKECGVNTDEVIIRVMNFIYGLDDKVEVSLQNYYDNLASSALDDDGQSKFLNGLEASIKAIIIALLASFTGCDSLPIIPNYILDANNDSKISKGEGLSIPISALDAFGILKVCPTSEEGAFYYNVDGKDIYYKKVLSLKYDETASGTSLTTANKIVYAYQECEKSEIPDGEVITRFQTLPTDSDVIQKLSDYAVCNDGGLTPNTLYKTKDLNALMWYTINKGMTLPQEQYNHMMWDNRISSAKNGIERSSAEEWNEWYKSKEADGKEFNGGGGFYPIIQLEPDSKDKTKIKVRIASQKYGDIKNAKSKFLKTNASIYQFNADYLSNIRMLHPKKLIAGTCKNLLGVGVSTMAQAKTGGVSITRQLIEAKLKQAIKNIVEADDSQTENCYMSFSNDEVNSMLEEMLLSRYNATAYNGESTKARVHDTESYIETINGVAAGDTSSIKKLVQQVSTTEGTEGTISYGITTNFDGNILQQMLWAIMLPIVQELFSPQILLLLFLNMHIFGIINLNDKDLESTSTAILNLFLKQLLSLVRNIVLYVKDKIIELIYEMVIEKISPWIVSSKLEIDREKLESWMKLLQEAYACLRLFKNKTYSSIDEVDYADIMEEESTPSSDSLSC